MTQRQDLGSLGFRIVTQKPRAPREIIDGLQECPTTDIADAVGKMFTLSPGIKPLYTPIRRVAGSALTVRVPPGDNLMVHAALSYVGEDDMIVVDARGEVEYAMGGALMCGIAKSHGARGLVVDGAYRDGYELQKIDFPTFARALNPKAPRKVGPGELNTVICCGGVPVHPGDIIVADAEGIVVVPLAYAEAVLEKARERGRSDGARWDDIAQWDADHKKIFDKLIVDLKCKVE